MEVEESSSAQAKMLKAEFSQEQQQKWRNPGQVDEKGTPILTAYIVHKGGPGLTFLDRQTSL